MLKAIKNLVKKKDKEPSKEMQKAFIDMNVQFLEKVQKAQREMINEIIEKHLDRKLTRKDYPKIEKEHLENFQTEISFDGQKLGKIIHINQEGLFKIKFIPNGS